MNRSNCWKTCSLGFIYIFEMKGQSLSVFSYHLKVVDGLVGEASRLILKCLKMTGERRKHKLKEDSTLMQFRREG